MFKIFDGLYWSDPAYVTVTIQPVNDNAPELSLVPRGVAYVEGSPAGVELLSDVMLRDIDHNEEFNLTALHVSTKLGWGKEAGGKKKAFLLDCCQGS